MKNIFKKVWIVVEVLIVLYCVLITTLILTKNSYGFPTIGDNTLVVMDTIRSENLKEGKLNSLLIISNRKNYKKGQTIYYFSPKEEEYVVKKAEIERIDDKGNIYIGTEKSETQLKKDQVAGKKVKEIKKLGKPLGLISSPSGFFYLVIFPTILVFIYLLRELVLLLKEEETEKEQTN